MKIKGKNLLKCFRILYTEIVKTIKEHPNHKINVKVNIELGGNTNFDADIIIDENTLVL